MSLITTGLQHGKRQPKATTQTLQDARRSCTRTRANNRRVRRVGIYARSEQTIQAKETQCFTKEVLNEMH